MKDESLEILKRHQTYILKSLLKEKERYILWSIEDAKKQTPAKAAQIHGCIIDTEEFVSHIKSELAKRDRLHTSYDDDLREAAYGVTPDPDPDSI